MYSAYRIGNHTFLEEEPKKNYIERQKHWLKYPSEAQEMEDKCFQKRPL